MSTTSTILGFDRRDEDLPPELGWERCRASLVVGIADRVEPAFAG